MPFEDVHGRKAPGRQWRLAVKHLNYRKGWGKGFKKAMHAFVSARRSQAVADKVVLSPLPLTWEYSAASNPKLLA